MEYITRDRLRQIAEVGEHLRLQPARPQLALHWTIDGQTGRVVGCWRRIDLHAVVPASILAECAPA